MWVFEMTCVFLCLNFVHMLIYRDVELESTCYRDKLDRSASYSFDSTQPLSASVA